MVRSRARRVRRRRRMLAMALALPLVVSGTAFMASNTVPASNAGSAQVDVQLPTSLSAGAATIRLRDDEIGYELTGVTAALTSEGTALVGQQVTFSAGGETLCTATTQAGGIAACPDPVVLDTEEPASYTATFAGHGPLHGSTGAETVSSAH